MDLTETSECLIAGRSTACIFHLMRAAEHGIRVLANKFAVELTDTGKLCPIEAATWDKIICAIKNSIDKSTRPLPKGSERTAQLALYSDAADHCTFMKDIWRNDLSHAGKPYLEPEALGAFNRVRDFMIFLANALATDAFIETGQRQ